jgi:hypothetical protein
VVLAPVLNAGTRGPRVLPTVNTSLAPPPLFDMRAHTATRSIFSMAASSSDSCGAVTQWIHWGWEAAAHAGGGGVRGVRGAAQLGAPSSSTLDRGYLKPPTGACAPPTRRLAAGAHADWAGVDGLLQLLLRVHALPHDARAAPVLCGSKRGPDERAGVGRVPGPRALGSKAQPHLQR